jgi:hypothetical protein
VRGIGENPGENLIPNLGDFADGAPPDPAFVIDVRVGPCSGRLLFKDLTLVSVSVSFMAADEG